MKTRTFILMAAVVVVLAYMAARLRDMRADVGLDGGVLEQDAGVVLLVIDAGHITDAADAGVADAGDAADAGDSIVADAGDLEPDAGDLEPDAGSTTDGGNAEPDDAGT